MDKSAKKKIILKLGSNMLTEQTDTISRKKLADIAQQVQNLKSEYDIIIVSSGAIAAAKELVKLQNPNEENTLQVKQALASIGQPYLMRLFEEEFSKSGLSTAQCLLSYADFENPKTQENISNTINVLIENSYVPIINENDTVSTDEIKFGDNDKLAALSARLLEVDLLVIATNTNGIYKKSSMGLASAPLTIKEVADISLLSNEISTEKSSHGTGGMASKMIASEIAQKSGIETWIVNGLETHFLEKAQADLIDYTKVKSLVVNP